MARTPAEGSGHRPHQSPSPGERATGGRATIALTASASGHAGKHGLTEALAAIGLGGDCAVGDLVSLVKAGVQHDFSIIRRRWIAGETGVALELMLDHPARP
jgi:hypothetical protein